MTELNKFGVIGLLHFPTGILPSHVAEKTQYFFILNYRGVGNKVRVVQGI